MDNCLNEDDQNDNWLERYTQSENIFMDYLKSVTMVSGSSEQQQSSSSGSSSTPAEDSMMITMMATEELPSSSTISGVEVLDKLLDFLCDRIYESQQECIDTGQEDKSSESSFQQQQQSSSSQQSDNKKMKKFSTVAAPSSPSPKQMTTNRSSGNKDLLMVASSKQNRGRSHSSVGVDEIIRSQTIAEINTSAADSATGGARKSRRVSLGMRPKFSSNWYRVKEAFKRDKSASRVDSKDAADLLQDIVSFSGDEAVLERSEPYSSSSHENTTQMSSSDEEFEYYTESFPVDDVDTEQYFRVTNGGEEYLLECHTEYPTIDLHQKSTENIGRDEDFEQQKSSSRVSRSSTNISVVDSSNSNQSASSSKHTQFLFDDDSMSKVVVVTDNEKTTEMSSNNNDIISAADHFGIEALREIQERYESLQSQLSHEFNEKYHNWNKAKRSLSGGGLDDSFDQATAMMVDHHHHHNNKPSASLIDRHFSPTFKQRFQDWQRLKGISLSPTRSKCSGNSDDNTKNSPNVRKKSTQQKSDWHKWRPGSKSESNVLRFLESSSSNSPDDFSRYRHRQQPLEQNETIVDCFEDDAVVDSSLVVGTKKQRMDNILRAGKSQLDKKKELAWLEKELQKVAREKNRLEKEKEKYAEQENRLQNMKKAIKSGGRKRKQEVLVPTSTGLFRFQGISSKFTRKLYEWEKARGISAESSTFALLDPRYSTAENVIKRFSENQPPEMIASLSRSRSMGSVEITGTSGSGMQHSSGMSHQQSSLSLNDVEQLEEVHLQVTDDNLTNSAVRLFSNSIEDAENEDDRVDGIECSEKSLNEYPTNYYYDEQQRPDHVGGHSSRKSSNDYDSENSKHCQSADRVSSSSPEMRKSMEQKKRKSANEDVIHITNQIRKLKAGTSLDDEDRMNTLSKLQRLADTLLIMVNEMNDKKGEIVDELAEQIGTLALELKEEIKNLSNEKLTTSATTSSIEGDEGNKSSMQRRADYEEENVSAEKESSYAFGSEGTYSDLEDIDSPTVHCTFTLPAWRVNNNHHLQHNTTPSSTESDSGNTKKKFRSSTVVGKKERVRRDSSGGDEDEETAAYTTDKHIIMVKQRYDRDSSMSTSNSDSTCNVPPLENTSSTSSSRRMHQIFTTAIGNSNNNRDNISTAALLLQKSDKNADLRNKNNSEEEQDESEEDDEYGERDLSSLARAGRESPKLSSNKRKCESCGKIRRSAARGRKISNAINCYCSCLRKDQQNTSAAATTTTTITMATATTTNTTNTTTSITTTVSFADDDDDDDGTEIEESDIKRYKNHCNKLTSSSSGGGRITRSKIHEFHADKSLSDSTAFGRLLSSNVIVPTTRTIFTPVKQDENGNLSSVVGYMVNDEYEDNNDCNKQDDVAKESEEQQQRAHIKPITSKACNLLMPPACYYARSKSVSPSVGRKENVNDDSSNATSQSRPNNNYNNLLSDDDVTKSEETLFRSSLSKPPHASPALNSGSRKFLSKDTNSSIRTMIAHYNQLTSQRYPFIDGSGVAAAATNTDTNRRSSEGSNNCSRSLQSSALQNNNNGVRRSPVLERKTQFERLNHVNNTNNEVVRKSKSAAFLNNSNNNCNNNFVSPNELSIISTGGTLPISSGILKSSSVGVINLNSSLRVIGEAIDVDGGSTIESDAKKPSYCGENNDANNKNVNVDLSEKNQKIDLLISTPYRMIREKNSSLENILQETKIHSRRLQEAREKFFNENLPSSAQQEQRQQERKEIINYDSGGGDVVAYQSHNVEDSSSAIRRKASAAESLAARNPSEEINESAVITKDDDGEEERTTANNDVEPNYNAIILNKSISTGAINDRTPLMRNLPVGSNKISSANNNNNSNSNNNNNNNNKTGRFGLSSIASKFRKVKMRRHNRADQEMSAVSSLCRASLLINIDKGSSGDRHFDGYTASSKSCPSSPVAVHRRFISTAPIIGSKRNSSSN